MEAIIKLKKSASYTVQLSGTTYKFFKDRGITTSNKELIQHCQAHPDLFDTFETKRNVPKSENVLEQQPESDIGEVETDDIDPDDEDDDNDLEEEEQPPPPRPRGRPKKVESDRGIRKRVKVE